MLDIYNVLDAISEIVYVSDAETHEILYINEAGKKILGDCLGETCYKLFHGKSAETVKNRLSVYHEQTQPLIDFYAKKNVLAEVDGTKDMEEVFEDIVKILGK